MKNKSYISGIINLIILMSNSEIFKHKILDFKLGIFISSYVLNYSFSAGYRSFAYF